MVSTSARPFRVLAIATATITLLGVAVLLVSDAVPRLLPADAHDSLAPLPLLLCALAYLLLHFGRRSRPSDWAKALIVVLAFSFWAANQMCHDQTMATVLNDIAIALFALDVFLVIIGPQSQPEPQSVSAAL